MDQGNGQDGDASEKEALMSETPRDCEHGQQARACRICELERELAAEREKSACIEMDRDHARLDAKTERERAERLMEMLQQESERCDKEVSQRIWADTELQRERERADRNQEDALTLMRALIKVRQQMFPQHDQRAVVSRDFPKLAAIDSARRK